MDSIDAHLRGEEFFDAAKFPQIKLESTSFVKESGDVYKLNGNRKAGSEVTGKINRKEFGLTWGAVTEAGAIVVGDDVKLIINVQFVKQA